MDNHQMVPKNLGLGSNLTVLGTRLSGVPRKAPSFTHVPSPSVARQVGDHSRLVRVSPCTVSLRY
jgi:hypothetical protein